MSKYPNSVQFTDYMASSNLLLLYSTHHTFSDVWASCFDGFFEKLSVKKIMRETVLYSYYIPKSNQICILFRCSEDDRLYHV